VLFRSNAYDTIYFTDSQEVAEFVHQKGIFKLIQNVGEKRDFDREMNDLFEERKRKREQSISEFKREVQRISEDKSQTIQEFKNQIELSVRTHLENERRLKESKEDINKIEHFYDDFLSKTNGLINQLSQNNGKLEEVKQIHNNNKILFNNEISDLKRPNYTTSIPKPKPKGNLQTDLPRQEFENRTENKSPQESDEKKSKVNIYKLSTSDLLKVVQESEAIVFDVQGMGMRCYTYLTVLKRLMDASAGRKIRFVVLDHISPSMHLGGQGDFVEKAYQNFAGEFPSPLFTG
jgi:hypothetical protein